MRHIARLPLLEPSYGIGFAEHRRSHASFAQSAAVAVLTKRALLQARDGT